MTANKTRREIAFVAARMMYERTESEYYRAKLKAAQRVCRGDVKPKDLPSNTEIRDQIQHFARITEGSTRTDNLKEMRFAAFRMMSVLEKFRPRLIGSVLTGHVRQGSDIDLHVFSNSIEAVAAALEYRGLVFRIERKNVRKDGVEHVFRHIHVDHQFPFELTVYDEKKLSYVFKSSITGKAIERASLNQLAPFLQNLYPDFDPESDNADESGVDRFKVYYSLLLPLDDVIQNPKYHPEGDVLYHSLQVYDLVCDEFSYDEELLLAALLHDIGKGIDSYDHVGAAIEALDWFITPRTRWLIANHMIAHKIHDGSIGARQKKRLQENESYQDLVFLSECDRAGRVAGVETTSLEDALDYIRSLALE